MIYFTLIITSFVITSLIIRYHIQKIKADQVILLKLVESCQSHIKTQYDILFGHSNVKFPAVEYEITSLYKTMDILESKVNLLKQEMDK